jgi:hypothetical protein
MITGGGGGSSTPALAFGTAAARPAAAAGNANTGYFATDTAELTVSNAAAWSEIGQVAANLNIGTQTLLTPNQVEFQTGGTIYFDNQISQEKLSTVSGTGLITLTNSDFAVHTSGRGLRAAEGANAKQGVATLVAGTIVVANTSVTATSRIMLTAQDNNTTGTPRVSARTAGTSFTITSSNAGDTGVVAYQIFEPG